LNGAAISTF